MKHGYMCSNRTNTLSKSPSRLNNNKKYEELPIEHSENTMRSLEGRFRELQEKYSELLSIVQLRNKER